MQTAITQQQKVTYPYLFGLMDTSKFATYRRSGLLKNYIYANIQIAKLLMNITHAQQTEVHCRTQHTSCTDRV